MLPYLITIIILHKYNWCLDSRFLFSFQGKVKSIYENIKNLLDPTPRFDSHISKNANKVTSLTSYRAFELTQVNKMYHCGLSGVWQRWAKNTHKWSNNVPGQFCILVKIIYRKCSLTSLWSTSFQFFNAKLKWFTKSPTTDTSVRSVATWGSQGRTKANS